MISDAYKHTGEWAKKEMHDEWLGFSENEIKEWLKEANFKEIEIEDTKLKAIGISREGDCTKTGIFLATAIK